MVLSMERWIGKVAVVTGASAGIGAAIVEQLVENGLKVVGLARRVELIEKHAKQLENKKGKLYAIKADMAKEEDILKSFQWVTENLGPIHVLINNAGVLVLGSVLENKTETWRQILNVNLIGLSIATRETIKIMREHKIDGHIIHINSIAGQKHLYLPELNFYAASKFGVTALHEIYRQTLTQIGSKIKVTSVSPGVVETEMTTIGKDEKGGQAGEKFKDFPNLTSEDIADGVIYALSTPPHVQVHELTIKPMGEPF